MRGIFVAMLIAFGIGVVGTSPTLTAPVNGAVIDQAAQLAQVVEQAIWRHRPFFAASTTAITGDAIAGTEQVCWLRRAGARSYREGIPV
jgi:hypothetical protein